MTKIKCGTREERTDWKDLWQEDLKGPKMGFKCVGGEPEGDGGPPSWKKATLKKPMHRGHIPRK